MVTGLELGEATKMNGIILRNASDVWNMEIMNETIADRSVTWQNKEQKSAILF